LLLELGRTRSSVPTQPCVFTVEAKAGNFSIVEIEPHSRVEIDLTGGDIEGRSWFGGTGLRDRVTVAWVSEKDAIWTLGVIPLGGAPMATYSITLKEVRPVDLSKVAHVKLESPDAVTPIAIALEEIYGRERVSLAKHLEALFPMASGPATIESLFKKAIEVQRSAETVDSIDLAALRKNFGGWLHVQGRDDEAAPLLEANQRLHGVLEEVDPALLAKSLLNLADVYRAQNRYREAEQVFAESERQARRSGDAQTLANVLSTYAGWFFDRGDYAETQSLLEESLEIERSLPYTERSEKSLASTLMNLAETYRMQGNYTAALPRYEESLTHDRNRNADPADIAWIVNQLGSCYADMGKLSEAKAQFREALRLRESGSASPMDRAETLHDLASVLEREGASLDAAPLYERSLQLRRKIYGPTHPEVARMLVEVARVKSRLGPARLHEAQKLLEEAIDSLQATPANRESLVDALELRARWHWEAGRRVKALADLEDALQRLEQLRPLVGGGVSTRASFAARNVRVFDELIGWLVDQGRIQHALECAERKRGRVFLDQLRLSEDALRRAIPQEVRHSLVDEERAALQRVRALRVQMDECRGQESPPDVAIREELNALGRDLDAAERRFEQIQESIRNRSLPWRGAPDGSRITSQRIQGLAPSGGALLVYQIGGDRSFVFLVPEAPHPIEAFPLTLTTSAAEALRTPSGPLTLKSVAEIVLGTRTAPVDEKSRGVSSLLRSPRGAPVARASASSMASGPQALHALWQTLVPSIVWARLRKSSEVVVIPDGALRQIPFEALVVEPTATSGQDVRYWLDDGPPIRYADSAGSLELLAGSPRRVSSSSELLRVASVADPSTSAEARQETVPGVAQVRGDRSAPAPAVLPPLPGSRREADAVAKAFAASSASVTVSRISGAQAQEKNVRALLAQADYIHLAVHGLFDPDRSELFSALVLTPPPPAENASEDNDGLLQLFEIYRLKLHCELAVLSACDTQVGRSVDGEGVFALSRGFFVAGSKRVVASLWPVNDETTADLVGDFFERIAVPAATRKSIPFAAALRDAKRKVRQSHPEPRYWAALLLTGAE